MPSRSSPTTAVVRGPADPPRGRAPEGEALRSPSATTDASRAVAITLGLLILLGAVVRFWGIDFGLPYTQARPDETQVMDVAVRYLGGEGWPQFYDYPRFYNYVLVIGYLVYYAAAAVAGQFTSLAGFLSTWTFDWNAFFLVNRSIAALAGILVIPVTYGIARRVAGTGAGLLAAFFMALAYGHVRDSHFGTTDTTLVLLCASSVLWILKSDRSEWGRTDVIAAVLAGLAAATKYNGIVLLAPIGIAHLSYVRRHPSGKLKALIGPRLFAVGLSFALAFAVGIPFVFFDYANFREATTLLAGSLGVSPSVRASDSGWWYHASTSLPVGLGLPLYACGLAGIVVTAWRDWRTAFLLFAFPLAYFGVAGWLSLQFVRYSWPILPFLCVAAAILVSTFCESVVQGTRRRACLAAVVAVLVIAPSAASVAAVDRILAQTDSRVVASEWLARHAAPGASIMISGSIYGYPPIGAPFRRWLWSRDKRAFLFRGEPAEGQPDWLLLQESPLPSWNQPAAMDLVNAGYERTMVIRAFDPAAHNYYDRRDALFVPFSGFAGVRRPGPNFIIYKRPGARFLSSSAPGDER